MSLHRQCRVISRRSSSRRGFAGWTDDPLRSSTASTVQIIFHPEAAAELEAAASWYSERSGRGARDFCTAVDTALARHRLGPDFQKQNVWRATCAGDLNKAHSKAPSPPGVGESHSQQCAGESTGESVPTLAKPWRVALQLEPVSRPPLRTALAHSRPARTRKKLGGAAMHWLEKTYLSFRFLSGETVAPRSQPIGSFSDGFFTTEFSRSITVSYAVGGVTAARGI